MEQADDKTYVEEIQAGWEVESEFLLTDLRLGQTKTGKPFVGLKLKDRSGEMEARVWDRAEAFFQMFRNGDVALVRGQAESYQNAVQMKLIDARLVEADGVDLSRFLPSTPYDPDEMVAELAGHVSRMTDPHLRGLMGDFLADRDLMRRFRTAPAAKRFHHAYIGGLLEHTLNLVRSARAVCDLYPKLNRDLMLCGAVWHDVGKVREFDAGVTGDYTDEGRLVGHLLIGVSLLEAKLAARPDFPEKTALLLKHLVVSHHGEYEMGSAKRPKILEALALHLIDDLDAKMNGIGGFIERHAGENGWTDYNRLMERYFYNPGPWAAVSEGAEAPPEPKAEEEEPAPESEPSEPEPPASAKEAAGPPDREPEPVPEPEAPRRSDREQLSFLED